MRRCWRNSGMKKRGEGRGGGGDHTLTNIRYIRNLTANTGDASSGHVLSRLHVFGNLHSSGFPLPFSLLSYVWCALMIE